MLTALRRLLVLFAAVALSVVGEVGVAHAEEPDSVEVDDNEWTVFSPRPFQGFGVYGEMKPYVPKAKQEDEGDGFRLSDEAWAVIGWMARLLVIALFVFAVWYAVTRRLFNGFFYELWQSFVAFFKMLFGKNSESDGEDDGEKGDVNEKGSDVEGMGGPRAPRTLADMRKEMEAFAMAGRYGEAIKYAYEIASKEIVECGLVVEDESKTPTERLREFRETVRQNVSADRPLASTYASLTWLYLQNDYGNAVAQEKGWHGARSMMEQIVDGLPHMRPAKAGGQAVVVALMVAACVAPGLSSCREIVPPHDRWDVSFDTASYAPFGCAHFDYFWSEAYYSHNEEEAALYSDTVSTPWPMISTEEGLVSAEDTMNVLLQRTADDDRPLDAALLASRLNAGLVTVVASEVIRLEGEADINEGSFYVVDSLVADVNDNKEPSLSSLELLPDSIYYLFPHAFCTRRINTSRLSSFVKALQRQQGCSSLRCYYRARKDDDIVACAIENVRTGGELILVSVPLLFTNFGVNCNDGDCVSLVDGIVGEKAYDRYMHRVYSPSTSLDTTFYATRRVPNEYASPRDFPWSDLLFILLKMAVLLCPLLLLARRHRPVAKIEKPQNRSADYISNIGKLYVYQKEYAALVAKKAAVFYAEVSQAMRIDASDKEHQQENASRIAAYAGLPPEQASEVGRVLSRLAEIVEANASKRKIEVTREEMRHLVNYVDKLSVGRPTAKPAAKQ